VDSIVVQLMHRNAIWQYQAKLFVNPKDREFELACNLRIKYLIPFRKQLQLSCRTSSDSICALQFDARHASRVSCLLLSRVCIFWELNSQRLAETEEEAGPSTTMLENHSKFMAAHDRNHL